jgi:MFS family permease
MSPVLAVAASDMHVSTAAAGQLRTIAGLAAGITALLLGTVGGRVGLGRQLPGACAVLAVASVASAAAPTFALLALAQVPVGSAVVRADERVNAGDVRSGWRSSCERAPCPGRLSASRSPGSSACRSSGAGARGIV